MNFPRPRHPQIGPDPGGIPEEPRSRPPRYVPPGPGPPRAGSRRIPGPPGSAQAAELLPPRFTTGSSAPFLSLLPIGQQGGISYCTPTLIGPARRPSKGCSPPSPSPGRRLVKIWPSARLPPFTSSPIRSEGRQSLRLLPPTTEPPRPQGRARGLHLGRAPAPPPSFPSPLPPPSAVASRAAAASSQSRAPLAARCLRRAAAVRSGRAGGAGATFTSGLGLGAGGGERRGWQGGGARQPRPLRAEPPGGARPSASAAQRPPARGGRGLGARRERSGAGLRGRAVPAGSCGVGPFPAWSRVGRVPAAGLPVFPSFTNAEFQHLRPHRRARLAPRALHARPFSLPRLVSPLPTLTR